MPSPPRRRLLPWALAALCIREAAGAASDALLGGAYAPTTDVEYLSDLTEVLQAIAEEDDRAEGRARYTQVTPDGVSLKDVALGNAGGRGHLSSALNPAYSVYTYALWRSPNGSGQDKSSQPREDMTFLDKPIDGYADAIVDDEFEKQSGYDKAFTAETIRATGMWMAAVTGLYDAADACRRRDENPPVDPGTFVSPVDAAAALWLGDAAAAGTQEGSSLYAWAARAGVGFTAPTYPDGVNQEIVAGLREMQALLDECLGLDGAAAPSEPATTAPRLYKTAEEVRGHMTVPLVQSLIRAAAEVGAGDTAADAVDRLILYGLVTLPPIMVCDEYAYQDMYNSTVTDAHNLDKDGLYDLLTSLYSRLLCLGLTCAQIGESLVVDLALPGQTWPTCSDPTSHLKGDYASPDKDALLGHLTVDLEVRTIGTLVEMEAPAAARDVYRWGTAGTAVAPRGREPLEKLAARTYAVRNEIGRAYADYFPVDAGDPVETRREVQAMTGAGAYAGLTAAQRRIVTEASLVLEVLHARALELLYVGLAQCEEAAAAGLGAPATDAWDAGFASLSGWAEEDEHARRGFLFLRVADYLSDGEVAARLVAALEAGRQRLAARDCAGAEARVQEIEGLLVAVLMDLVAYFSKVIERDRSDEENASEAYGAATALLPLVQKYDKPAALVIQDNLGSLDGAALPLGGGSRAVSDALRTFYGTAGAALQVNCTLVTRLNCDYAAGDPTYAPSAPDDGELMDEPTYSPSRIMKGGDGKATSDADEPTYSPSRIMKGGDGKATSDADEPTYSPSRIMKGGDGKATSDVDEPTYSPSRVMKGGGANATSDVDEPTYSPSRIMKGGGTSEDVDAPTEPTYSPSRIIGKDISEDVDAPTEPTYSPSFRTTRSLAPTYKPTITSAPRAPTYSPSTTPPPADPIPTYKPTLQDGNPLTYIPPTESTGDAEVTYPTYSPTGVPDEDLCRVGVHGGVGMAMTKTTASAPLLGGAYVPTSNVDHITRLTTQVESITGTTDKIAGLAYYQSLGEDGVSLRCLSTGTDAELIQMNPLYEIAMYGLWVGGGDAAADGYSWKTFDGGDILHYGDTVVMDELSKSSGYDGDLTAQTARVVNMWMATATELYRAADTCREGYDADARVAGFNPADNAAAFWLGTAVDEETPGSSLYAWAKRAEGMFVDQSEGANSRVLALLTELQEGFKECPILAPQKREAKGLELKHLASEITRWMMVPMLQYFIHHLAIQSGLEDEGSDNRNHMVLYAIAVLPFISICDEETFTDLYNDLVTKLDSYDSATFQAHLEILFGRLECLGITCDMIGTSIRAQDGWPTCEDYTTTPDILGYTATSDAASLILKFDLDISTILSFIVMGANYAALDIYENGRNVPMPDGLPRSFLSLSMISIPDSNQKAIDVYEKFANDSNDYTRVTKNAILGSEEFSWSSPLQNSAAASLAIATIDMHLSILDDLFEAISLCADGIGWAEHWDGAAAGVVGWVDAADDERSAVGYLFFQLAEELCGHYDNCHEGGGAVLNDLLLAEFKNGRGNLQDKACEAAETSMLEIQAYLRVILVDSLAYHAKVAEANAGDRHCLLAHVARNALVPLLRPDHAAEAETIDMSITASATQCQVKNVDAIYAALKTYAEANVDCSLLRSSVCGDASGTDDFFNEGPTYESNDNESYTLFDGEYTPMSNVETLHGMSTVVRAICTAADGAAARDIYANNDSAGLTIKSMSTAAKYVMDDELQFHQYVNALRDGVDKTDGTFLFDLRPAAEYANTITSDALDTSVDLACRSVKALNLWMWTVHKLNEAVRSCRHPDSYLSSAIDEAAALWEGGLLYRSAQGLGSKFGAKQVNGMAPLNRKIVLRLNKARDIVNDSANKCDFKQVHDLRIIVKETVSYMTAVLIQGLIDAMFDKTSDAVELMAFAVLPHIRSCGHNTAFDTAYDKLVKNGLTEDQAGDILSILQSHYNCLGLSCDDVGRHEQETSVHPRCSDNLDIAGYAPTDATKTNMLAKIDLDAVAIHQLMSMEKYDVAKRIYLEGHNYYDYDNKEEFNFVSLYNFTQKKTIDYTEFAMYQLFDEQLDGGYKAFVNTLIVDALDRTGIFQSTSATQRELAVDVTISSFVSYMSALEALYYASSVCYKKNKVASTAAFDGAVALLVGSVEGRGLGGSVDQEGRMFYSISKRTCNHFDTCVGGDSEVNKKLFAELSKGQAFIKSDNCGGLKRTIEDINTLLKVPLMQSLVYFSDYRIRMKSDDDAAGYIATKAVFPILNEIDSRSAETIEIEMDFQEHVDFASKNTTKVPKALKAWFATPGAKDVIDCNLVAGSPSAPMCRKNDRGDPNAPKPDKIKNKTKEEGGTYAPTSADTTYMPTYAPTINKDKPVVISKGLYVATNYVSDRTAIALDVQEIKESLEGSDVDRATYYYTKGEHSKIFDSNGMDTNKRRSIAGFGKKAKRIMKADPTYNLFLYGISDENQEFLGKPATDYADTFISNLLYSPSSAPVAPDAMVAVTIWMQVIHSLHSAHAACNRPSFVEEESTGDGGPSQDDDSGLYIDEAAAYWIGDDQAATGSSKGHLLYALTESIGSQFEDIPEGAESEINTKIIDLFNQAKNHIAISRDCTTSSESHFKLKGFIDKLIPLMAVPLLRNLLFYLSTDDPVKVQVYAIAVLPLFSACSRSTYLELKSMLIDNVMLDVTQKDYIYSQIQSMYSCLGLTCDVVGFMKNDDFSRCEDSSNAQSLAGYKYVTDQDIVNSASHIDVDIAKIDIFIGNGARHFPESEETLFQTAFDIYKLGRDSTEIGWLGNMARDPNRDVVPTFGSFQRYFNTDKHYADTIIENAFLKKEEFKFASVEQRRRVIAFSLKYMLTYMAALEKLYTSIQFCKERKTTEGAQNIDVAAGYIIGSLEGPEDGGSYNGNLIFMLAKRMCVTFGTCTLSGHARINERIISMLYASQSELETGACESLTRTVKEIENAMAVPLIQGVLVSAMENERYSKQLATTEFYPEGYVLAQSILPLIDDVDHTSALEIAGTMVYGFPSNRAIDANLMSRAMQKALSKMDGVDCSQIGSLGRGGFCPGDVPVLEGLNQASHSSNLLVSLVACSLLLFTLY